MYMHPTYILASTYETEFVRPHPGLTYFTVSLQLSDPTHRSAIIGKKCAYTYLHGFGFVSDAVSPISINFVWGPARQEREFQGLTYLHNFPFSWEKTCNTDCVTLRAQRLQNN